MPDDEPLVLNFDRLAVELERERYGAPIRPVEPGDSEPRTIYVLVEARWVEMVPGF